MLVDLFKNLEMKQDYRQKIGDERKTKKVLPHIVPQIAAQYEVFTLYCYC
jgi:hypothetical protein